MRKNMRIVMAALLGCALMLAGCDRPGPASSGPLSSPARTSPKADAVSKLPVVRLADLQRLIDEAKANKQVLVIDFWATWCIPCVEMFPELHEKLPAMGPQVRLVSVTLDAPGKLEAAAIEFLGKHHAIKDAYRIADGIKDAPPAAARGDATQPAREPQSDDPLVEVIEALGKQWHDLEVPVILVFGPDGQLKDEFLRERARPEVILPRVREIVAASKG